MRRPRTLLGAAILALGVTACASFPANAPRDQGHSDQGYRYDLVDATTSPQRNHSETLVLLAFSGGGSRAAAMAYGVLEQLRRTCVTIGGERRRLLDEVDVISSNSGGSYTAAYFGLYREATFGQPVSDDVDCRRMASDNPGVDPDAPSFEETFLRANFEQQVKNALFNPYDLWRVGSPYYNRSDLAAEVLDSMLFDGHTFGSLDGLGKPFILINAHDVVQGNRFQFTQEYFDYICSDLSSFAMARAVIASSAVHGLFGAIRLRNYPSDNCAEPPWVANDIRSLEFNPESYQQARTVRMYRLKDCWRLPAPRCNELAAEPSYVRLNDGGAVDNLGVRSLVSGLEATGRDFNFLGAVQTGKIKKILLISVNAAGEPDTNLYHSRRDLRASELIEAAVNGSIDTVTLDSMGQVKRLFQRRQQDATQQDATDTDTYHDPVLISFEHLADQDQARCLKNIPTRLRLSQAEIDSVRMAGAQLLRQSMAFQSFLTEFDGNSYPVPDLLDAADFCRAIADPAALGNASAD